MNLNQYNIIMFLTTLTPHKICMYIVHVSTCTYTNKVIGVCTLFKSMDNFSEVCAMTSKQETRVRLQLCPKTGTCCTCLASTVRYHSMTYTQSTKPTAMTHAEAVSRVWTAAIQVGISSHLCFPKNYNNRATILIACELYVTFCCKTFGECCTCLRSSLRTWDSSTRRFWLQFRLRMLIAIICNQVIVSEFATSH